MSLDLGVHYGGSSMQIAYVRDENRSIIVNETGDRWTPSIFAVNDAEFVRLLKFSRSKIKYFFSHNF